jgi:hypothetical protein
VARLVGDRRLRRRGLLREVLHVHRLVLGHADILPDGTDNDPSAGRVCRQAPAPR